MVMMMVFFQVELNPGWQQKKLRDFCKEKGIQLTAWGPLGANGTYWGSSAIMDSPILKEIAESKGKTVAQVLSVSCHAM